METRTAFVPSGCDVSRCKFVVGDACNMFDIKLPGGAPLGETILKSSDNELLVPRKSDGEILPQAHSTLWSPQTSCAGAGASTSSCG